MLDQNTRDRPKNSIEKALTIFKERCGEVIVEIGSMRQPLTHLINIGGYPCCNDGHSSVLFAMSGADFFSVDIDPVCTGITKAAMEYHGHKDVHIINEDGLSFLSRFDKTIDLLFLDAWDIGTPLCSESHLKAYTIAKRLLNDKSLILIDDTDIDFIDGDYCLSADGLGGKGKLIVPEAIKDGYTIVFKGRQTLLSK